MTPLYHRAIVEQMTKKNYLIHLFKVYESSLNVEKLMILLNKMLRFSKGYAEKAAPGDLKAGLSLKM